MQKVFNENRERYEVGYATCVKLVKDGKKRITKKELEKASEEIKKITWKGFQYKNVAKSTKAIEAF